MSEIRTRWRLSRDCRNPRKNQLRERLPFGRTSREPAGFCHSIVFWTDAQSTQLHNKCNISLRLRIAPTVDLLAWLASVHSLPRVKRGMVVPHKGGFLRDAVLSWGA